MEVRDGDGLHRDNLGGTRIPLFVLNLAPREPTVAIDFAIDKDAIL